LSRHVFSAAVTSSLRKLFNSVLPSRLSDLAHFRIIAPLETACPQPGINNLRTFLSVNYRVTPTPSFTSTHRVRKQGWAQICIPSTPDLDSKLTSPLSTFPFTRLSASRPQVHLESHAYEKCQFFRQISQFVLQTKDLRRVPRVAVVEISQQRNVAPCVLPGVS